MRFTILLHNWARSDEGFKTYLDMINTLRGSLPPDELVLNLVALVLLHDMRRSTSRNDGDPLARVQLADVSRLFDGYSDIHNTLAILRGMVWSLSLAIPQVIPPDSQESYLRLLHPAQAAVSTIGQSSNMSLVFYWTERLRYSFSNAVAEAQTNERVSAMVDINGEDEKSNCNSTSTPTSNMSLVKHIEADNNGEDERSNCNSTSTPTRWNTFLKALRLASCGGQRG